MDHFGLLRGVVPEAKIAQCYRAGVATLTAKPPPSTMVLHVEANEEGKIQTTSLSGAPPIPERAGQCVMRSMVGKQVTSEGSFLVSGDIDIVFSVD